MANEFVSHATNTIKEVAKLMQERGSQYADTWGADGCWHLTKAIVKHFTEKDLDQETLKAIALACFCDQKYSRFAGGYKEDTAVDLIPYLGALVDVLKK
jgi:hypothetical protein